MLKRSFVLVLLLPAALVFGQGGSLTVTASRSANLQPDQVVFGVSVDSALDVTREQVLAAVQGAGITLANFTSVSTVQRYQTTNQQTQLLLEWSFSLPVALSSMKSTIGLMSAVQTSIATAGNGLALSFSIQGTQVSAQLQQSQTCSLADLISDARAQGAKMAGAAGMSLGAIQAMSSATVINSPSSQWFNTGPPACSLTVKFALGAF
jgi:hypothetical protein